ncbi:peptidylglycine alpha-amidating monooxygenase isoform X2 [Lampris incognitus]|uniref:peptidylglycine alpha-amidating monooxygenase isoform X2 n=1 Tax=Lampris incognitus TaxID=2546036 RepID=UPI0024B60F89|nr:peptidylglycine alpha-amidating monooxygenase isoform X2 [Lampris incognitus]
MGINCCCIAFLLFICSSSGLDVENAHYRFKRSQGASLYSNECMARQPVVVKNSYNFSLDIRMPGVVPTGSDMYVCMAVPVPASTDLYIVDFVPHANMETAHHMLLYGCQRPVSTSGYWDCGSVQGTCEDEPSIMYGWGRNAPHTKLPKDVGFKVGGNSGISYFVLQIHYGDASAFKDHHKDCSGLTLTITSKPQPFVAGMYLLMSVDTVVLPGKRVTNADIACAYGSYPIYPFAFRTHTHQLGRVVSGYRIRNGKWTLIGRQSPRLPQAFYTANKGVDVRYGDTVAARCVFTGDGRTSKTYIGGTSEDEMCNFYIMYYMESKHAIPFMNCLETGSNELFQHIPAEANVPAPVRPDHMTSMVHSKLPTGYHLEEVTAWPESLLQLGQVSGLALDSDANLVIFHRGDHLWGSNSFDSQGRYQQRSLGPIQQSTILVVDPVKGHVLKASGRNMFYLPHGITADTENNYWVTDVALHQVLKVSSSGRDKVLLVLGEAFEPGSDNSHFCQPTDVAVDTVTGNLYIADGYCNARILKFSPHGRYLFQWGAGSADGQRVPFRVPHSLAYLADRQELCVADRENGRIQCFIADSGDFIKEIKRKEFGGEVFAISYSPGDGGLIYAVNGESPHGQSAPLKGFVINYSTNDIIDDFRPHKQEFKMPHDVVVHQDGSVFVGDAGSDSVSKFTSEKIEAVVQTNLRPVHRISVSMAMATQQKMAAASDKQSSTFLSQAPKQHPEERKHTTVAQPSTQQGVSPSVITTLLLVPLLLVISIGIFIRWKKSRMYGDGCDVKLESSGGGVFGKLRGKAAGGLNLGNFFATHKGYTGQGFDRLISEGSDQEKNDEDSSDSENEEYSALPPPSLSSS